MPGKGHTRRLVLVGGATVATGLVLGVRWPDPGGRPTLGPDGSAELALWLLVRNDDRVIVRSTRSEMGQGTLTGLAQLAAEELDCAWSQVTVETVPPAENLARQRAFGDYNTGGSIGLRGHAREMRRAGAAAKAMLIEAAARRWGIDPRRCLASEGRVFEAGGGRSERYGALALDAARLPVPRHVSLKPPSAWRIAGQPLARLEAQSKITGAQVYGYDLQLPGMVTALVSDCPVEGGRIGSMNEAAALASRGVRRIVRINEASVAVVADGFWPARKGLDALAITWQAGPNGSIGDADCARTLAAGLVAPAGHAGHVRGDAAAALARAPARITSTYAFPNLAHAPMEPMNATARVGADRCEVWCPTQNGEAALDAAARASGLPKDRCTVHMLMPGGGFGRRLYQDYVTQAVRVAREIPGTPVKLLWTREEDMLRGRYHPAMQARLDGAVDGSGRIAALGMRLSGQSIFGADADPAVFQGLQGSGQHLFGYAVPNLQIDFVRASLPLKPGLWRGVNINQNILFLECFIDELAAAAKLDPLAFRRANMVDDPRRRRVLDAVAERLGWEAGAAGAGRFGIAQAMAYGTYVAGGAELEVSAGGRRIRLKRLVAAIDPGHVANPGLVARQVEGSFVFGLSALFLQAATLKDGRIAETNFDTYDCLRLGQLPAIETIVMPSGGDAPWGGAGEPAMAVAAPAVLNALFAATGRRVREPPLRRHGITLA